jgi:ABC-2 type transport system permease protein
MLQNLKIEWMKIKNYKVFQVFSILYLLGLLGVIFIFYKMYMAFAGAMTGAMTGGQSSEGKDIFQFFQPENITTTVCFATSFLLYFPGMVVISLFTNEVNFKTHRQNIIDGWKRSTFIYSKIALIFCISIFIVLMNLIATFCLAKFTHNEIGTNLWQTLGLCFLQTFTYLMFALTLAILFRKSGVAIILFFIYGLIVEFVLLLLLNNFASPLGHFLPLQTADNLLIIVGAKGNIYRNVPQQLYLILGTLAYCFIYIFFAVRKYTKDDL